MSTIESTDWTESGIEPTIGINELEAKYRKVCKQLAEAQYRLTHDPLTGLLNRDGFDAAAQKLFSARAEVSLEVGQWLIMVDLDDFKPFNDTYGHHVGDEVLVAVGKWLTRLVGHDQTIARLQGDEFAGIVDDFAFTCLQAAELAVTVTTTDGVELAVKMSIGAASLRLGETQGQWMRRTDSAMRRAKAGAGDAGLAVWDAIRDDDSDIAERPLVRTRDLNTAQIAWEVA